MTAFVSDRLLSTAVVFLAVAAVTGSFAWSDSPPPTNAKRISDQEAISLGVVVSDSPGVGVLVVRVAFGSPAQEAGIKPGDFVLSADGKSIDVPSDLVAAIRSRPTDQGVKLGLWRRGEEISVSAKLAIASEDHRSAWLGVYLDGAFGLPDQVSKGAVIAKVLPGSPAEDARLRVGDLVVAVGDQPIKSAEQLIELIGEKKPGEVIHLTINRDGMETAHKIELGSIDAAPPSFSDPRFPFGFDPNRFQSPQGDLLPRVPFGHVMRGEGFESMQKQMDEFRTDMEEMRKQLKRLRRGDDGNNDADHKARERGNTDARKPNSPASEARAVIDRLPTFQGDDFLAAPPYYGPYGYPQGFSVPQYNPYGFHGGPPYSGGFHVPWYSYPSNSPHIYNYFGQRLPYYYYYKRGGRHYYYPRRSGVDRSIREDRFSSSESDEASELNESRDRQ